MLLSLVSTVSGSNSFSAVGLGAVATPQARPATGRLGARWLSRRILGKQRRPDVKLSMLRQCPGLSGCGQRELVALGAATELLTVQAGTAVADGANPRDWWWMPLQGTLIVRRGPAMSLPGGEMLAAGEAFGLVPRVGTAEPMTVVALEHTTLLVGSRAVLRGAMDCNPRLRQTIEHLTRGQSG